MTSSATLNIYSPSDVAAKDLPRGERVFISHRSFDKPLATAVAKMLQNLGIHYWFDAEDQDTQNAAALGMAGDQALVHAIERGIKHSSQILGLLSDLTRGSWWVPYEIGQGRALQIPVSYLMLSSVRGPEALPEYVRLAATYWSVDELIRWVSGLLRSHIWEEARLPSERLVKEVAEFVPRSPPEVTPSGLSIQALAAIASLGKPETQKILELPSTNLFDGLITNEGLLREFEYDWLPTTGGFIRDLAYDLLAPLALFQLGNRPKPLVDPIRIWLKGVYDFMTLEDALAQLPPPLRYERSYQGMRQRRYPTPAKSWPQGIPKLELQLALHQFFLTTSLNGDKRLVTKEEFKAEFDRTQSASEDYNQRRLAMLVNPLFGFSPAERPFIAVYYVCNIDFMKVLLTLPHNQFSIRRHARQLTKVSPGCGTAKSSFCLSQRRLMLRHHLFHLAHQILSTALSPTPTRHSKSKPMIWSVIGIILPRQ
jgi:hypothetical protein